MSISAIFQSLLLLLICGYYLFVYHLRRRRLRQKFDKFSGPPSYPVIGNLIDLLGSPFAIIERAKNTVFRYPSPTKVWLFSTPVLFVHDPENIQTVMNNVINKGWMFEFFKQAWGDGVATTNNCETWKAHRCLLNPAFDFSVMGKTYLEIYHNVEQKLIQDLDVFADLKQSFDLWQFVHNRETRKTFPKNEPLSAIHRQLIEVFGPDGITLQHMHALTGYDTEVVEKKYEFDFIDLVKSARSAAHNALRRVLMPWLHPEIIYKMYTQLTGGNSSLEKYREILQKIVRDRYNWTKNYQVNIQNSEEKSNRLFLDILLDSEVSADYNDRTRVDEIITFLEAGSITITAQICWILLMFAMHQEHQDRVYEEIKCIFRDKADVTETQEFGKLNFMEQCIKETLRLFPPGSFILRINKEDLRLNDGRVIPADTLIISSLLFLHRNENIYSNPHVWDPNRFLPEEVIKRHPCSFAPFTTGPRMCPGPKYAYLSIKSQLVALLQKYRFTTDLKMSDIKLTMDPVLRNATGYPVCIHRRK